MSFICEYIKDELKESLFGEVNFKIDVSARLVAIFTKINFLKKISIRYFKITLRLKIHQKLNLT